MNSPRTLLVCEDGRVFVGTSFGATGSAIGELIATTSMTGYQETLTAGESAGAILLFATPHIGNVGMNDTDGLNQIRAKGLITRETPRISSNWRAQRDFVQDLKAAGTVGISEVDTRALLRHLQQAGPLKVGIFSGEEQPIEELINQVQQFVPNTDHLISTLTPAATELGQAQVAVVDLGQGAPLARSVQALGMSAMVVPVTVTADELHNSGVEKVIFSSGPGNPADATSGLGLLRDLLDSGIPLLGIGLGHELLARTLGYATKKLPHPHYGANHPVKDLSSGRVFITAHAHSYSVGIPSTADVQITHVSLNDDSVEGFRLVNRPVYGIQFALGTQMGPTDANHLLDSFLKDA